MSVKKKIVNPYCNPSFPRIRKVTSPNPSRYHSLRLIPLVHITRDAYAAFEDHSRLRRRRPRRRRRSTIDRGRRRRCRSVAPSRKSQSPPPHHPLGPPARNPYYIVGGFSRGRFETMPSVAPHRSPGVSVPSRESRVRPQDSRSPLFSILFSLSPFPLSLSLSYSLTPFFVAFAGHSRLNSDHEEIIRRINPRDSFNCFLNQCILPLCHLSLMDARVCATGVK